MTENIPPRPKRTYTDGLSACSVTDRWNPWSKSPETQRTAKEPGAVGRADERAESEVADMRRNRRGYVIENGAFRLTYGDLGEYIP